jgi:hypothetical protein
MKTTPAVETVTKAAQRLHDAEHPQRDAIGAPLKAGASLWQIATKTLLSHEQLRRIVRDPKRESPTAYRVTVERRGVAPLDAQLVVRADSERAAAELASWIAERKRGGIFEATKVRPAPRDQVADYDDADL